MSEEIVVVGSANVDYIMSMSHLPRYGETVTDADFSMAYGGKGANQAVAVARAGGTCAFVACVGDDANAEPMVQSWESGGVDTSAVTFCSGISSGSALVMIGEDGGNYISIAPGSNYRLEPDLVEPLRRRIADARFLLLQYEIPRETIAWLIDLAAESDVETVWNFAPARDFPGGYEQKVDYLIVNEVEAGFLARANVTSAEEAVACARSLVSRGTGNVAVTLGSQGCVLATREECFFIPAFSVEAVDTTAAGDVFCGALSVGLADGLRFQEAARFASAASALSVTSLGAQPSAPQRERIDAFLAERGEEITIERLL